MRASLVIPLVLWCTASAFLGGGGERAPAAVRYGRDVRPILADRCFQCHGFDDKKRQADLRLDVFESATTERDGVAAIVPGKPDESELLRRIEHADVDERMPPESAKKKPLTAEEKETLARWIEVGAPYEPHWAFVPPAPQSVPAVADAARARNELDRFLLATLEREGLGFAPEASPETQLRRLFLTLTGLPPTAEELAAFLADPAPDRYERTVARIFAEEPYRTRFAEHLATPWLDQARYADTSGIHMDAGRQMWLWRDWVLEAYRSNLPFDRFLTDQLAGDLFPDASVAQKIASGFNRNHVTTDEGGAIAEEYLVEYAVDRASTTGAVFLGLTLGCARCHEHKFDPFTQDEFFRFYSFFNSIEEPGLYSQLPDPKRAFEPFLVVPRPEQEQRTAAIEAELVREREVLDRPAPEEDAERAGFLRAFERTSGLEWAAAAPSAARSHEGATLTLQEDGSVLASGANPDFDTHELTLVTHATDLRLVALEALGDASFFEGRVGRAPNGNAVLSGISLEARSLADPAQRRPIELAWAWADVEQQDGDYGVTNALEPGPDGWAVAAHQVPGGRAALFLAREPFGYAGGTELVVTLAYRSVYAGHTLGRVRLSLATLGAAGLDALPLASGPWLHAGPFATGPSDAGYSANFGPEADLALDRARDFGGVAWRFRNFRDGVVNDLEDGVNVHYLGRELLVPSARTVQVSLGSDDGYRIFLDGREVTSRNVPRAAAPDQDEFELALEAGRHALVFEVVNTGGQAGFYWRWKAREGELAGALLSAFLPASAQTSERATALARAWRLAFSPDYRARSERIAALTSEKAALEATTPRTMVMAELPTPRETYVLMRGAYDKPDKNRPVTRGVPAVLGDLPPDAPRDRRGLAQWMTSAENPLVARVAVNRFWELVFAQGLVRTTEDFGLQGEWPSHPELVDWLARDFREHGWDVQRLLTQLVTSSAFRQEARVRPEASERDPDNRWLAYFPKKRLTAEAIRDQALYVGGLLVEKLGGESVKPYQPDGLWQEVAMLQSNTREFVRGNGEDLWRRSLYTYWKRACPPPSLLTFDAPTREFCTIRRASTNTPLQALVLWNDEQFVEAARALAARELGAGRDERATLVALFTRCTARAPDSSELELLAAALADFRARYAADPEAATALIEVGESPVPAGLAPGELAAWTLLSNALLNLDEVITRG